MDNRIAKKIKSKNTKIELLLGKALWAENLRYRKNCNYDKTGEHPFYEYKMKNYITDAALGMTPGAKWTGKYDANGGYIIVKEDGELVCYHIYNRNEFQDYLIKNTKLDTPSSSRNGFGVIYKENENLYFKLNLQVRFI